MMRVSVFGLGYVGVVSAGCLSSLGYSIIGVDPNLTKVSMVNQGASPIIEKGIDKIIADSVQAGTLSATDDVNYAVMNTDLSLICVGTPSQANGSLDLKYVRQVCEEIGIALSFKSTFHVVVLRSTMLPGTTTDVVMPTLEKMSGKRAGIDFGICVNPEFLREGSAVDDYFNPPKTIIGSSDDRSAGFLEDLYGHLTAPLIHTDMYTAEMVKYADNAWHALKIGFANEIGNICKELRIDGKKVMDIFCQDTKLNLSSYYLKPGFAFGGSCLPKDVRALTYKSRTLDLQTPILNAILPSNRNQIERGLSMIQERGNRRVGILGFSFKAGTDDLRESPLVTVIEQLIGKGFEVKIYDQSVNLAALVGANREYIFTQIPHISRLMVDSMEEVLDFAETVVIGNEDKAFKKVFSQLGPEQCVIDLVRIDEEIVPEGRYDGICW